LESLKARKIEEFQSNPIIVSPTSPVSEVIGVLQRNDAYQAFIQKKNKVSTITVREILKASHISNMKASSLMFSVSPLSPGDTVGKAATLMKTYRLRALPIVVDATVVGVVTVQSLCEALLSIRGFEDAGITKIINRNLVAVAPTESVSKARSLLLKNGIDHLPVLESGRLCGIFLSKHIVFSMLPSEGLEKGAFVSSRAGVSDFMVSALMDSNTLTCEPKERAVRVLARMLTSGKTYSLVKFWDELHGIVTYRDFVFVLAELEPLDIPAYIVGLPDDPFEAELAKTKFMREARVLGKAFPKIEEMRSVIKTKEISENRRRYEVKVSVRASGKAYAYSAEGWELPSVFDEITSKMRRLLAKRRVKRSRERLRKVTKNETL
jgi:CBS domain-containing protein/ribosome-associated translation inhibitor RaiA